MIWGFTKPIWLLLSSQPYSSYFGGFVILVMTRTKSSFNSSKTRSRILATINLTYHVPPSILLSKRPLHLCNDCFLHLTIKSLSCNLQLQGFILQRNQTKHESSDPLQNCSFYFSGRIRPDYRLD